MHFDLSTISDDLAFSVEEFKRLPEPDEVDGVYAAAMQATWRALRRRGIARLLADADQAGFFASLEEAASLRRHLLLWAAGRQSEPELAGPCRASDLGPFFDALAARRLDLAVTIARASEAPMNRRYEYEEDYRYAQFLFAMVQGADASNLGAVLGELARATEGEETGRYLTCKALMISDNDAFEAALARLVEEHEEHYGKLQDGIIADPEGFATERYVMVEGLGLKVLARERGLVPAPEHRFMPANAFLREEPR